MESFEDMLEDYLPDVKDGDVRKGVLVKKDNDYSYIDIPGLKGEGVVKTYEVESYQVGDEFDVVIMHKEENGEGTIRVSRIAIEKKANWEILKKAYESGEIIDAVIEKKVNGGFILKALHHSLFMPGSLSLIRRGDENKFIKKEVKVMIKELKEGKNNKVIVSRKDIENIKENAIFEKYKLDDIVEVEIKEILKFGLTVLLESVRGFIHISEVAWEKVEDLNGLYKVGDKVEAKIIQMDQYRKSIKLSLKSLLNDPWQGIVDKYKVGDKIKGKIVRIEEYGAFIEIIKGVEALIHVSDMSWDKKVVNVSEFIKKGDTVEVKIIEFDPENRKMKASIKETKEDPWSYVLNNIHENDIVKGTVIEIKNFGIFCNIADGVDVFVHISDLKWVTPDINEYKKGDTTDIMILEIDKTKKRLKGGIKQLSKNNWDIAFEEYNVGERIKKPIKGITRFGLFIELTAGVDAMIHISEVSSEYVKNLEEKFKVGDIIEAKIIEMNREGKKIKLSRKALEDDEIQEFIDKPIDEEENQKCEIEEKEVKPKKSTEKKNLKKDSEEKKEEKEVSIKEKKKKNTKKTKKAAEEEENEEE